MNDNQSITTSLFTGDVIHQLKKIPTASIDAVITDPPYAEVKRDYGTLTELQWMNLMQQVVSECRRVLRPRGSAVFILQPNSKKIGSMRPWLWDFMSWLSRHWNIVQDCWWWNHTTPPSAQAMRRFGLMRASVKACIWAGDPDCHRYQDDVLWTPSQSQVALYGNQRFERKTAPGGISVNAGRIAQVVAERGGVTPFNLLPVAGGCPQSGGHPAVTPPALANWWVRYISRPGQVVLDPFSGSGTVGVEALRLGRSYVGIERDRSYMATARRRLAAVQIPSQVEPALADNTPPVATTSRMGRSSAARHGKTRVPNRLRTKSAHIGTRRITARTRANNSTNRSRTSRANLLTRANLISQI